MFDQITAIFESGDPRYAVLLIGFGLTAWAAVTDIRHFRIPNRIPAALVVAGTVWILISQSNAQFEVWAHLATAAVVLIVGFGIYAAGWFGAGDAKLLAALSLWFGPVAALVFLFQTAIFGGIFAIFWLRSGRVRMALAGLGMPIDPEPPRTIPYGVAGPRLA